MPVPFDADWCNIAIGTSRKPNDRRPTPSFEPATPPVAHPARSYNAAVALAVLPGVVIRRRITEVSRRLSRCRQELRVAEEQLGHFSDSEADAHLRSLVSETPLADREFRDAARHAEAMAGHRDRLRTEIAALENRLDELLDRLSSRRAQ